MRLVVVGVIMLMVFAAGACSADTMNQEDGPAYAIFLVKGELPDNAEIDLDALELEGEPVLTDGDIARYYWDDQIFVTGYDLLRERLKEKRSVSGIPFVAVAGRERVYLGYFWTMLSSLWPRYPCIFMDGTIGANTDLYDVGGDETLYALVLDESDEDARDMVFDPRIHDALEGKGLLK